MRTTQAVATCESRQGGLTTGLTEHRALASQLMRELDQLEIAIATLVDAFATMRQGLAEIDHTVH